MGLPLPRVVADVGPGGPLVTAMGGMNSLANDMLLRKINAVKAQYAPLTTQAEAMSKLAYANLMGPQFLAKMMGNPDLVASLPEGQKFDALKKIYQAGTGQGTGANAFNQMQLGQDGEMNTLGEEPSFSQWAMNGLKNIFGQGQKSQPQNTFANPMPSPQQVRPRGQMPVNNNSPADEGYNTDTLAAYDRWMKSPQGQAELAKGENAHIPDENEIRSYTFAENAGNYRGIIEEGKELGKIRATSKKELDQDYQQALQLKQPFQKLNSIIKNPVFQKLRQLPGFQSTQMNAKSKIGNAEEQKLIGEFQAAARNVVAATVKGFGGRILASEIPLSESMKLSDNDTIGVMLGKAPVIEAFNEMTLQRSRMASQLMKKYHLDKGDALERADKMVDGEAIRKQAENALEPAITEEDIQATIDATGMTREQIIQRLKAEGRYNG